MNLELYGEKILMLLKEFPATSCIEQYQKSEYLKEGIQFCLEYTTSEAIITLTVQKLGLIKKYVEFVGVYSKNHRFSCSLINDPPLVFSKKFYKNESDTMCERLLPFMLSYGKDKSTIPLILNDFPEFANLALRYP